MDIFPSYEIFKELGKNFKNIPVYTELIGDMETPVSAFLKLRKGSYNFLLESAEQEEKVGRYSFLGTNPELVIRGKGKEVEIYNNRSGEKQNIQSEDPTAVIDRILAENRAPSYSHLPGFTGGLIGYFSYDFVRQIEKLPDISPDTLSSPDFFLILVRDMVIFDHFKRKIILVANVDTKISGSSEDAYKDGCSRLESLKMQIEKHTLVIEHFQAGQESHFKSNFNRNAFTDAVKKTKKYIREGDIIQAVISQRWQKDIDVSPFNIYRALRTVNPSPYMFYLDAGEFKLVGSSPEILVKLDGRKATIRPIAGTRPRGRDEREEIQLEKELLADEKERAEHIMLVDLGRNDLGRVCIPGSVKVTELMTIEKYSHVMHIVSNVEGTLKPKKSAIDLISASFPAGTVSGAPKIRAMEIIEELEPEKRGPYAGAVGYFSFQGNMDFCITIRTFFIKGDKLYIQAGAGIVADSVPEREYRETENKAKGLMEAYLLARRI
ncbi:MAG TPA: anthranilate synthase component I [bacterium]|nr:anthranilate synthase component I [bacterium]HPP30063.1 anthranilate synthase component I [bacterium]